MKLKSEKTAKLIFFVFIAIIAAYILYTIISYYTADKIAEVSLSFENNETNIMTSAKVRYNMKPGEGTIMIETNEKTEVYTPKGKIGNTFAVKNNGNKVSKATITVSYDDKALLIDEKNIILIKVNEKGESEQVDFRLDTNENTISTDFTGDGMWCLADKNAV